MATPVYCTVEDLREEGFKDCDYNDARVQRAVERASRYIDMITGRFFFPLNRTFDLNWRGVPDLLPEPPIIAVDEMRFVNTDGSVSDPLEVEDYIVFNRHVRQGLLLPDDRDDPKISFNFLHPNLIVPNTDRRLVQDLLTRRVQNIRVKGRWGFTDPDPAVARTIANHASDAITSPSTITRENGAFLERDVGAKITLSGAINAANNATFTIATIVSPKIVTVVETTLVTEGTGFSAAIAEFPQSGSTPSEIARVCMLIAAKMYLVKLAEQSAVDSLVASGRVTRMSVRDQSITLQDDARVTRGGAEWTGDPEIDTLLARYMRPPRIEAV